MNTLYRQYIKRTLDVALAATAIVATAPLMATVWFVIWLELGSPVIFRQTRVGLHGRLFRIAKFRTMRDVTDADGRPSPDESRLTRVGKIVRAFSLDELPQLFHVLTGEMSLVGPRPLLPEYLPHYSERQATRHSVRPGLTGLAQVNGRNATTWEARLEHDASYVERVTLGLDLWVLMKTALRVIAPAGVAAPGHATMPRFDQATDQNLIVIGAGGHGKVIVEAARALGLTPIVLDDDPSKSAASVVGCKVQGNVADAVRYPNAKAILAIGDNELRRELAARLDLDWRCVVHPRAIVSPSARIGRGAFVAAGAVVGPDACVGAHSIINTSAVVDHDVEVGDFSHIAPCAVLAGDVRIGEAVLIGAGAKVIPRVKIGSGTTVGAGAAVVRELPRGVVAVGVPAQVIRNGRMPGEGAAA